MSKRTGTEYTAEQARIDSDVQAGADCLSPQPSGRTVPVLYISNGGEVVCAAHGGGYLSAAVAAYPKRRKHSTPLGVWEAVRPTDPDAAELAEYPCEACGATLAPAEPAPAEPTAPAVEKGQYYRIGRSKKQWYCFDTSRAYGPDFKTSTGNRWTYKTVPADQLHTVRPY